MRVADVVLDDIVRGDMDRLRGEYPQIDSAVEGLANSLRLLGHKLPHKPIREGLQLYAIGMDYRPLKSAGKNLFLVTYHATPWVGSSPNAPTRTITLLTITLRLLN